ncbi:lytic murein transglycosylase [Variovorax sp. RHLX14]|uniref:lytic murein transglycosylase n=1 Tax=Variovorax sp. RHLX14 TaxID=1259731 RepID=UPI003F490196
MHFSVSLLAVALLAGCALRSQKPDLGASTGANTQTVHTTSASSHDAAFADWVKEFRCSALASGIGESTLDRSLKNVTFLPRVIDLDRAQPEFTRSVWDYLDRTVSAQRVTMGREMLQRIRSEAPNVLQQQQTVPPEVVVAIWGMESNYGSNFGSTSTIDALATLGFEGRRSGWARNELLAALKIVERGDIAPERMIGSWAGAMGQTQFLPSSFLAYAIDGDGDGRRDIWNSLPDVVASTANYLAKSGWQPGQPWGVEVRLPALFDYVRADPSVVQSAMQWNAEGVMTVDGSRMPDFPGASVLLPAGAGGPAFLVGANFRAILKYNNSTSYALAVGSLSQQITGGLPIQTVWPRQMTPLSRAEVVQMQEALAAKGFPSGAADGLFGPATRSALRSYQREVGLVADGFPNAELLRRLLQP